MKSSRHVCVCVNTHTHTHTHTHIYIYIYVYTSIYTFLPFVLYGCENWSLTLRKERRLRVFENMLLRRVFWPTTDEVTGNGENYIMRNLVTSTFYPILCGW